MPEETEENDSLPPFVVPLAPYERLLLEEARRAIDEPPFLLADSHDSADLDEEIDLEALAMLMEGFEIEESGLPSASVEHVPTDLPHPLYHASPEMDDLADPLSKLFDSWSWASTVSGQVKEARSEEILADLDGDLKAAFDDALHWLKSMGDGRDQNAFRVAALLDANPSFPAAYLLPEEISIPIPVIPPEYDDQQWQTLAIIRDLLPLSHLHPTPSAKRSFRYRGFKIWKVLRQFHIAHGRQRRTDNGTQLLIHFLFHPAFESRYTVKQVPSNSKSSPFLQLKIVEHQAVKEWHEGEGASLSIDAKLDLGDMKQLGPLMRLIAAEEPLDDPRSYLEFIPWEELEGISLNTLLNEEGVDVEKLLGEERSSHEDAESHTWFAWNFGKHEQTEWHAHLLHTEDEVFQYCICQRWPFPGYMLTGDRILFSAIRMEDTKFIPDFRNFWNKWNDCAVTSDPVNGVLYLLETIPGRQFRHRHKTYDETLALLYFRRLVEERVRPTDSEEQLIRLLGDAYHEKYRKVLRYIHPSTILDINLSPLGKGSNGLVYGAVWNPEPSYLHTMRENRMDIVLKQIRPDFGTERMRKIVHELNITFTALSGLGIGCVQFLGITTLMVDSRSFLPRISSENVMATSGVEECMFLVFERASEDNMLRLLEIQLRSISRDELVRGSSWKVVLDALGGISSGIVTLHKHGIIHGDLHPNNVLGTLKHFQTGPLSQRSEHRYLISDLGEGKLTSQLTASRQVVASTATSEVKYKIGEYAAPELLKTGEWSYAVDAYSFGQIAKFAISYRSRLCSSHEDPDITAAVPVGLKEIVEACLDLEPGNRPTLKRVDGVIEDLRDKFDDGSIEWSRENDELAGLSSDRGFYS